MKKLLIVLALIPFFAFVVADWVPVKIDERVTVSFPTQPLIRDMSGNSVWVQDIDSSARCMAMIIDFSKFGTDSAALAEELSREGSFDEFRQNVMGQIEGSTLISETKSTIFGKTYFEYVINMGQADQPGSMNIMYSRNIFAGGKMYTLSFFEKTGQPRNEDRNKFYNSLKMAY